MKNNLATNITPMNSERQHILENEIDLFSTVIENYDSFYTFKRGFFWSYIKGVPFYNLPFKVRHRGRDNMPDYIFPGSIMPRYYHIISAFADAIHSESELHPLLRKTKLSNFTNLSGYFNEIDLPFSNLSDETLNRSNSSWILVVTGKYLDIYFHNLNKELVLSETTTKDL